MSYKDPYTTEQAMQTFHSIFNILVEKFNRRNDQLAWHIVYWLYEGKRIVMGDSVSTELVKEALDKEDEIW